MVNKWLIYSATYSTYTLIHSVRTCWASLKTVFTDEPYEFSEKYLGILDMVVLFTIAVLLNIFGGQVERYSRRKLIFAIIIGLILDLFILFMLVVKQVTNRALYFFFYMLVGILSCLSWPICLYVLLPASVDCLSILRLHPRDRPLHVQLGLSMRRLPCLPDHSHRALEQVDLTRLLFVGHHDYVDSCVRLELLFLPLEVRQC